MEEDVKMWKYKKKGRMVGLNMERSGGVRKGGEFADKGEELLRE